MDKTLRKKEKIKSKLLVEKIFKKKKVFSSSPLCVFYIKENSTTPTGAKVMVSVPKKKIKKAVDRNLIKRRIRSAYQEHKASFFELKEENNYSYLILFIYLEKKIVGFSQINQSMEKIIYHLKKMKPI